MGPGGRRVSTAAVLDAALWCIDARPVVKGLWEVEEDGGIAGTARRGIRPGAVGGWKLSICTCILHFTSSMGVLKADSTS